MSPLAAFTDPLFRLPLAAGLLAALTLPLLGNLLRLREEWLAALGLAHISAAGALGGMGLGIPAIAGGPAAAGVAALFKGFAAARGNTAYAQMILLGWSTTLVLAANTALGESLAHAMVDGQLYFSGWPELLGLGMFALLTLAALPWITPRLIRARFFPEHERANRLPAWRWHLAFDLLAAAGMALGTATVGLMGAFALAFLPAWAAFGLASGWRAALLVSTSLGVGAYLAAFVAAMAWDQPFGPVLVAVLLATAGLVRLSGSLLRAGKRVP
ncbi:metal ABC transporter permease [Thiohalorhabdus methylotrophus]|uniref:Metal ABC transporter permease n=1 Tax=Thiohalorhabdus methylotrophus TaxID=3242694 RepID=A0ABV4TUH4_9GAMM